MKVLFMVNLPAPYRVDFFSELGKLVDLTVIYERDSASDRNEKWTSSSKKTYKEIYLKSKKIGTDNSFSFEIIKYLKNNKFDHIVVGQYSTFTAMLAIIYMKVHKIPFIINSDGGFINKNENKLKYRLKRFFISSAKYWLSTGKHTTDYLNYYGANSKFIFKYPFSSIKEEDILNPNSYDKKSLKKLLGFDDNKKIVISVGSCIRRKGFDILINAAKYLNDNIIVLIVGGKINQEYQSIIEENSITNVIFKDFMKKEELKEYYKAADLFVLPTREDIWGLVINEALANNLPVITSKYCGAGLELIKNDYNGFIVENNEDYEEYARIINKYLNNPNELYQMSNETLSTIKEYTIENMALVTLKILNEIKD